MPTWRASDGRGNPPVVSRGRRNGNGRQGFRLPGVLRFLPHQHVIIFEKKAP